MSTPTAVFPAGIASNANLKVAANLIQTTLKVGCGSADTILFVNSTAGFVANCLVSIDKEILAVDSVSTGTNPSLIVNSAGRGFDGTTAASHSAGAKISILIDAWHHNVLSSEVQAIETFLGPNGQNIGGQSVYLVSNTYDFPAQTPGGALVVGNNTMTLSPVPAGVNGTDQNHYVYISGGTGTAEAAKITGGSAVSGAPTGTLIVQCANTHSGSWTIKSATAGIQEAVNILGTGGGIVVVPLGTHNIYATITLSALYRIRIIGAGIGASILAAQFTSGDLFTYIGTANTNGYNFSLSGFSMSANTPNTLTFVHLIGAWYFYCFQNFMSGASTVFKIEGNAGQNAGGIYIFQNNAYVAPSGIGISVNGAQDLVIRENIIQGNGTGTAVMLTQVVAGIKLIANDFFRTGTGLLINPGSGQMVAGVESLSNYYDSCQNVNIYLFPGAGGKIEHVKFLEDWVVGSTAGPGLWISGNGQTDDLQATQSIFENNGTDGILIDTPYAGFMRFTDLTVGGNSAANAGTAPGFALVAPSTHIQISGGHYCATGTLFNSQSFGIYLGAFASDYVSIRGADVRGNMTGGLANGSTGTHNYIQLVDGYNPVGQSAITVGASPFTYTAGSCNEIVYIYGGTVSNVSVGSTQVAAASPAQVTLSPHGTVTVTYSVIPNMVKDVQ